MTNDELKKKIAETIQKARNDYSEFFRQELKEAFRKGENHFGNRDCSMTIYDYIADALIAAEIGDVSSEKAMRELAEAFHREKCAEYDLINYKLQKAEHRAEVAERALNKFAENVTCEDCPFFSDCSSSEKMKDSVHPNYCFAEYLRQAEKELAEEGKE